MRRFQMHRHIDVSGISGTGIVAEGVVFTDGTTVVRWISAKPSTVVWDDLGDAYDIHNHGGSTEFVFLDPEER